MLPIPLRSPGALRGEKQPAAKLTEDGVREIRRRYRRGASISELARDFEVSRPTIRSVLLAKTWAHVVDEEDELGGIR